MELVWRLAKPFDVYIRSVRGTEHIPRGQFLLAANHESAIDGPILMAAVHRSIRFVAAGHLLNKRQRLWLYNKVALFEIGHSIPSGNGSLERCKFVLAKGNNLGIFPEGEIHPKYRDGRIRTGAMVLSHQMQVPILPVHIIGSGKLWPITSWLRFWKTHAIDVVIGAPITPPTRSKQLSRDEYQQMSESLMRMIQHLR